ncbi:MAG: hydroxymethylbilane synthase, partial [Planctomycetia bacterium]
SRLRIATRASRLALWQAEYVQARLVAAHPGLVVELVKVVSTGDAVRDRPLHEIGGVGVFTKEVQDAVLDGRADLAVHSLKDLPTVEHPALVLAAVPERGSTADVLLAPTHRTLDALPLGATVATSSLRRRSQLLHRRPDLNVVDVRGNVETRIRKLYDEGLHGLVLAAAGLERLELAAEITHRFTPDEMLPAVGQGALGIECRADDAVTRAAVQCLDHWETHVAVLAERGFLRRLQGGCQVPIGALALLDGSTLTLRGLVAAADGHAVYSDRVVGPTDAPAALGAVLADALLARGAAELLKA